MEIKCPQCKKSSPAHMWTFFGTVVQPITIYDDEIEIEPDSQFTYFISSATCPNCGVEFEIEKPLTLEWFEEPKKLYPQLKQLLENS